MFAAVFRPRGERYRRVGFQEISVEYNTSRAVNFTFFNVTAVRINVKCGDRIVVAYVGCNQTACPLIPVVMGVNSTSAVDYTNRSFNSSRSIEISSFASRTDIRVLVKATIGQSGANYVH